MVNFIVVAELIFTSTICTMVLFLPTIMTNLEKKLGKNKKNNLHVV